MTNLIPEALVEEKYQEVLQNPETMPSDEDFEPLLSLAALAYEQKTNSSFDYIPPTSYETFSNPEGWDETLLDKLTE